MSDTFDFNEFAEQVGRESVNKWKELAIEAIKKIPGVDMSEVSFVSTSKGYQLQYSGESDEMQEKIREAAASVELS